MNNLHGLLDRNATFATSYTGKQHILPRFNTMLLTCADARIDPAHFLGLQLGEAVVMRNAGARVTDGIVQEVGILWTLAARMAGEQFAGMGLAIIHHTDCGMERLANPQLRGLIHQQRRT